MLCRSLFLVIVAVVSMGVALPSAAHPVVDLKAYCKQLIAFYDRYGTGRSQNSDGRRNHTRIGADIDCKEDNHDEGIAAMSDLLERKRFEVPDPSTFAEPSSSWNKHTLAR
jgi:hypothetical protein